MLVESVSSLGVYYVPCTLYTPQLETLSTNTAEHTTTYFYWLFPQNCNFSKVRHRLPDDGPCGPKYV